MSGQIVSRTGSAAYSVMTYVGSSPAGRYGGAQDVAGAMHGGVNPALLVEQNPKRESRLIARPEDSADLATEAYSAEVLADAPVLYWRLGEGSGLAADSSGYARHASLQTGAVLRDAADLIVGSTDGAFDFTADDSMQATQSGNPSMDALNWVQSSDHTAELWFKGTTTGQVQFLFGKLNAIASLNGWKVFFDSDNALKVRLGFTPVTHDYIVIAGAATTYLDGNPHHLVVRRECTTQSPFRLSVFIDGVEIARSGTGAIDDPQNNSQNFRVGIGNPESFVGTIDEVACYNWALPLDRIIAHYEAGSGTTYAGVIPRHMDHGTINPPVPVTPTINEPWTSSVNPAVWDAWNSPIGTSRLRHPLIPGYGITMLKGLYDFTGAAWSSKLDTLDNEAHGTDVALCLAFDVGSRTQWNIPGSNDKAWGGVYNFDNTFAKLRASVQVNGVDVEPVPGYSPIDFDPLVHKFFRIREFGGTLFWDWSTDGVAWTNYASYPVWCNIRQTTFSIASGNWVSSTAGFVYWDDTKLETLAAQTDQVEFKNDRLYLLTVSMRGGTTPDVTVVEGGGISWAKTQATKATAPFLAQYWGLATSGAYPDVLAMVVTGAPTTLKFTIEEFENVDTTTPIVQTAAWAGGTNTDGSVALSAFGNANNLAYSVFSTTTTDTYIQVDPTLRNVQLFFDNFGTPTHSMMSQVNAGPETAITTDISSAATNWSGTALEIAALPSGPTFINVSDSGTAIDFIADRFLEVADTENGADTSALTAALPVTDSGVGVDVSIPTVAYVATDTAVGTDTAPILGKTVADAAVGADASAVSQGAAVAASDVGTATDTSVLAAAYLATDTGVSADTAPVLAKPGADAAVGTDSSVLTVPVPAVDAAVAVDTSSVLQGAAVTASDTASGADVVSGAARAATDVGTGADTSVLAAVLAVVTDSAIGADISALSVPIPVTDVAVGADVAALTVPLNRTDAAVANDASASTAVLTATDGATGVDTSVLTQLEFAFQAAAFQDNPLAFQMEVTEAAIPKAASDSGTGSEVAAVTAIILATRTDAAVGVEASALAAVLAASDTATGADLAALTAPLAVADAAVGSEASAVVVAVTATDTAAGADASVLTAAMSRTDAGTAADVSLVTAALTVTDSISSAEMSSLSVPFSVTDAATGVDTSVLGTVLVAVTDLAVTSDTSQLDAGAFKNVSDTGTASDVSLLTAVLTATDSGTSAETAIKGLVVADTAVGSDLAATAAALTATDTASGADVSSLITANAKSANDSAVGVDTISAAAWAVSDGGTAVDASIKGLAVVDAASGADASAVVAAYQVTDSGSSAELSALTAVLIPTESATAVDTSSLQQGAAKTASDTATASDVVSTFAMVVAELATAADATSALSRVVTDSATGLDTSQLSAGALKTASDSATALDTSALEAGAAKVASDVGTAVDTALVTVAWDRSDSASGTEVSSYKAAIAVTDTAVGVQTAQTITFMQLAVQDSAHGVDVGVLRTGIGEALILYGRYDPVVVGSGRFDTTLVKVGRFAPELLGRGVYEPDVVRRGRFDPEAEFAGTQA